MGQGTKKKQAQRKAAQKRNERRIQDAEYNRRRIINTNIAGMAADLNEIRVIQTVPLDAESMAELEARGIQREVLEQMQAAGMHWNPVRESFEGGWEPA